MKLKDYLPTHCDTSGLLGLSKQIADILLTDQASKVINISAHVNISGASTILFLQKEAGQALIAAIAEKGSKPGLVHAIRVLPQQAAVSYWYLHDKMCGITLAATPGTSPHERGIAIDINNHAAWKAVLKKHGWMWRGASDPAHFNYHGGHDPDFGIEGIRSFQKLWNLHNAGKIEEDGVLGPITQKKLGLSPIEGFS
jgi:N-acetylmuramoyl-L-alanine amidase